VVSGVNYTKSALGLDAVDRFVVLLFFMTNFITQFHLYLSQALSNAYGTA
jgi:hypothetical protein